jgi:hypothetical protein
MSIKKMTREDFIQSPADDTRVVGVLKKDWDKTTITENGQEKLQQILQLEKQGIKQMMQSTNRHMDM